MTIPSFLEILILNHGTAVADLPTTISKVESPFGHGVGRFRVTSGRVSFLLFLPPLTPKLRPGRRLGSFGCRPSVVPPSAGIPIGYTSCLGAHCTAGAKRLHSVLFTSLMGGLVRHSLGATAAVVATVKNQQIVFIYLNNCHLERARW